MRKIALVWALACIFLFAHNSEASEDFSGTITLPRYEYATSWNYDAAVEGTDGAGHYWIGFFPTDAAARDTFHDQSLINLFDISYSNGGLSFAINSGIYVYSCNSDFTVCQVSGNFSHWITAQLIASSYDFGIGVPVTIGTGLVKLTVNQDPPDGGSVTVTDNQENLSCTDGVCKGSFPQGTKVTLVASPESGWVFDYWDDGIANYTQNPLDVVMDKEKIVTAKFKWNSKITLTETDSSPLGDRTPLILVHGNRMETEDQFGWDNYLKAFGKDSIFQSQYKIYLFSWDSEQSNAYNGQAMGFMIDNFPELENTDLTIMAHSRGGIIARYFMNQHTVKSGNHQGQLGGEKVKWLVTLATPHRGSPAADPIWIEVSFDYNLSFPVELMLEDLYFTDLLPEAYRFYDPESYPNLLWDDVDNKSTAQAVCYNPALNGETEECVPLMSKTTPNNLSELNQIERYYQKIVVFGGNNYSSSLYNKILDGIASLTYMTTSGIKIWAEHNFMDMLTILMERMPIIPPGYDRVPDNPERPFKANDGMVPLDSALFLKPGASNAITFNKNKLNYDNSFCQVAECNLVDGMIDHLGFLDDNNVISSTISKLKNLH